MASIEIPSSLTSIGSSAFDGCTGLTSIDIPNSVTSIGKNAFWGCTGLTSIDIPNSVTSIGDQAFYSCDRLTSVIIGNSVTSIGSSAFEGCTGLTSIEIPNSVTSIGSSAFERCTGLTSIEIPNSVTSIGSSAFYGCTGLTSIEIPNSVTSIGGFAFYGCTGITTVTVKAVNPPVLSRYTFSDYETPKLIVPDGAAFYYLSTNWKYFTTICEASSQSLPISYFNDEAYKYALNSSVKEAMVIANNNSSLTTALIPRRVVLEDENGEAIFYIVTAIGSDVFKNCTTLANVTFPATLSKIYDASFYGCSALMGIALPDALTHIGNSAFAKTKINSISLPEALSYIGDSAFAQTHISSISLPEALTHIGNSVFQETPISNVSLPSTLTYIGNSAFAQTQISNVSLPEALTYIGNYAFDGTQISELVIPRKVTFVGDKAFGNLDSLIINESTDSLNITSNSFGSISSLSLGRNISSPAFNGKGLTNLRIGNLVTDIPAKGFANNPNLTYIELGSGIESISAEVFSGCTGLPKVVIPSSVKSIGNSAFAGANLKSLTIGCGIESIGENAFNGAADLAAVNITALTPPAASNNTFSSYSGVLSVTPGCAELYDNFARCWYRFSDYKDTQLLTEANGLYQDKRYINGDSGTQIQLKATIAPADASLKSIFWKSSNPEVATVDTNGLVTITGDTYGDYCEITAFTLYADSPVAKTLCTVGDEPKMWLESVTLSETDATLVIGESLQLEATVNPANAINSEITWSSSDESVATVDETGLVTAVGSGAATITATADGISASCCVNVNNEAVGISEIEADSAEDVIYNLQGVRVTNPVPGLYIVNGAKVLIK